MPIILPMPIDGGCNDTPWSELDLGSKVFIISVLSFLVIFLIGLFIFLGWVIFTEVIRPWQGKRKINKEKEKGKSFDYCDKCFLILEPSNKKRWERECKLCQYSWTIIRYDP